MAQQGWYPDPSGRHGLFRWFDGRRWTAHTTTDPRRGAPAAPTGDPGRARVLLVVGVVLVAVVALVGVLVARPWSTGSRAGTAPSSTVSPWDEVTSRPPTTPSATPGRSTPAGTTACEPATGGEPPDQGDPGRVHGGPLSFPTIPGWERPAASTRFPHGRSSRVTTLRMEEDLPWQSSAEVGELVLGSIGSAEEAPELLLQCVLSSSFYTSVDLEVAESGTRALTVDGHPAHQLDARITFEHPRLQTTGSVLRIVVVDAAVDGYWFSAVPQERDDLVALVEDAAAGLRVEG